MSFPAEARTELAGSEFTRPTSILSYQDLGAIDEAYVGSPHLRSNDSFGCDVLAANHQHRQVEEMVTADVFFQKVKQPEGGLAIGARV